MVYVILIFSWCGMVWSFRWWWIEDSGCRSFACKRSIRQNLYVKLTQNDRNFVFDLFEAQKHVGLVLTGVEHYRPDEVIPGTYWALITLRAIKSYVFPFLKYRHYQLFHLKTKDTRRESGSSNGTLKFLPSTYKILYNKTCSVFFPQRHQHL